MASISRHSANMSMSDLTLGASAPRPARRRASPVILALVAIALAVTACSGRNKPDTTYIEGSVEELYNRGMDLLLAEKFKDAAKFFTEVDRQHPYSTWATRAQLMAAYSYYRDREYDTAVAALDRFIRLHPGYRDIAYAYYLRALCHFSQLKDVSRDQAPTRKALEGFQEVSRRFPNSKYASDSRRKILLLRDQLAGHEMFVGRYYQKRGQQIAAINRFRVVVEQYQTTSQVPEALLRLSESYTALGLTDEARKVAAVLGYNYPASEWYVDSYELVTDQTLKRPKPPEKKGGFLRRTWDWLF